MVGLYWGISARGRRQCAVGHLAPSTAWPPQSQPNCGLPVEESCCGKLELWPVAGGQHDAVLDLYPGAAISGCGDAGSGGCGDPARNANPRAGNDADRLGHVAADAADDVPRVRKGTRGQATEK